MSDAYIRRSAAIDLIRRHSGDLQTSREESLIAWVISTLRAMPAADVVPVVRCKNCKWFADNNDGEWYGCKMFQVVRITTRDAPGPDDFCSCGERKDGDAHAAD